MTEDGIFDILILDDDDNWLVLIEELLTAEDASKFLRIHKARNLTEAEELLRRVKIDAATIDVHLKNTGTTMVLHRVKIWKKEFNLQGEFWTAGGLTEEEEKYAAEIGFPIRIKSEIFQKKDFFISHVASLVQRRFQTP